MLLFLATGDALVRIENGIARAVLGEPPTRCLAVSGETVWAGGSQGIRRSDDGGATWSDAHLDRDVFSLAVGVDGAVYAGCEPSAIFRSEDGDGSWAELESLQRIPSRPTWSFPPRPWTSHVRWLAPSPHDPALLLAGIELGGLMRSTDRGKSWDDHRPGAHRDVHQLAWHPAVPGRAYEAGGEGAAWSSDGGETWRAADEGRDRDYTWALAVDPEDPDVWFVSVSTGPGAAHGGGDPRARIYRWRGSGPWEALDAPVHAMPYALAFTAGGGLVAGYGDGSLHGSDDRGETWKPLEVRGESIPRILAVAAA